MLALAAALPLATAAASPALAHDKPVGYLIMCLKSPADCAEGGATSIQLSETILATLNRINRRVNNAIPPRNDPDFDQWGGSASGGDCEDYAIAKRRALMQAGLPPSALRFVVVTTRTGKAHAVLVVKTDRGELALDNLTNDIKPLSETGYKVVSRL